MGFGRWYRLLSVPVTAPAATDLDLISYQQAIPYAHMRRGVGAAFRLVSANRGDAGDPERLPEPAGSGAVCSPSPWRAHQVAWA